VVVVLAALLLAVLPALIRLMPLPRLLPRARSALPLVQRVTPARAGALVCSVAARLPWRPACLTQALASAWVLVWTGSSAVFVLAVAPSAARFDAHAWCTPAGQPDTDRNDGRWHELVRWPLPLTPPA
jgi:hypothetical protein